MLKKIISSAAFSKKEWLATGVIFFVMCGYYFYILYNQISTDVQPHAAMAHSFIVNHDRLTPNFLYFFLVAALTGFSKNYHAYYVSSILLISAAIALKFAITDYCFKKYTTFERKPVYSLSAALIMLFVFALPGAKFFIIRDFYLGQIAANVWHNSTVIFLMPFALLLFFASFKMLGSHRVSKKEIAYIVILILLNALIKPSFLFALLPSVAGVVLFRVIFLKYPFSNLLLLLPFAGAIFLIAVEYFLIYKLNYVSTVSGTSNEQTKVVLAPFEVWNSFSANTIPAALLSSLFFPFMYIVLSKGAVLKDKLVQFALLNFATGLLIWILFAEEGGRKFHGNFYWQNVPACYLVFFSMLIYYSKQLKNTAVSKSVKITAGSILLLHFLWGIFYWAKIIIFKGYS
jgi:hypothetical protein